MLLPMGSMNEWLNEWMNECAILVLFGNTLVLRDSFYVSDWVCVCFWVWVWVCVCVCVCVKITVDDEWWLFGWKYHWHHYFSFFHIHICWLMHKKSCVYCLISLIFFETLILQKQKNFLIYLTIFFLVSVLEKMGEERGREEEEEWEGKKKDI